jgi:hypothetical protein
MPHAYEVDLRFGDARGEFSVGRGDPRRYFAGSSGNRIDQSVPVTCASAPRGAASWSIMSCLCLRPPTRPRVEGIENRNTGRLEI